MSNSGSLLRQYVDHGSEPAFAELVAAHMDLVFSTALRKAAGDTHLARDISQRVFIDLAHKASSLPSEVVLAGWLHRHTCLTAAMILRSEYRRRAREQTAAMMNEHQTSSPDADASWSALAPALDDAVNQLAAGEREAVLLRFYERRDLRAVGTALGISDDAAQKRVARALEKLRGFLSRRGITLSAVALSAVITERGVQAAPVGFAAAAAATSLAAPAVTSSLWMIMKTMLADKTVVATGLAILVLLVGPLYLLSSGQNSPAPATSQTTLAAGASGLAPADTTLVPAQTATNGPAATADTMKLRLAIVAADSGKVIPNVELDYRVWVGLNVIEKKLVSDRLGICEVTYPSNNLRLDLTTRVDGFADTQLFWETSKGDVVPTNYVLRVIRPEPIAGSVVDPSGMPVSGATVSFGVSIKDPPKNGPESHRVGGVQTVTDETGHWRLNRFAPQVLGEVRGAARHSDYADSEACGTEHEPEVLERLRAGTQVFQLRTPFTVQGTVMDDGGQPVPEATVYFGTRNHFPTRRARTGEDGAFKITGCRGGQGPITVEAAGFAPNSIDAEAKEDAEPVQIVIQRGRWLRVRVVDETGQAVPQVHVSLGDNYNWGPNNPVGTVANFSTKTGADGRAEWKDVPPGDFAFNFQATGFMRLSNEKIALNGVEHMVVLRQAREVTGTVRDAATGELVPRFQVTVSPWLRPHWAMHTNDLLEMTKFDIASGKAGRFSHHHPESRPGMTNLEFVLQFQADGYLPAFSRLIRLEETNVQLEMRMRPAKPATIMVRLPDGSPAAGARAALVLVSRRTSIEIFPGGLISQPEAPLVVDADGRLELQPGSTATELVVAHDAGFVEVPLTVALDEGEVRLQSWGRLEIQYERDGLPLAGRGFSLWYNHCCGGVHLSRSHYPAETDAQGKIVFPRVPPGELHLDRATERGTINYTHMKALPGETTFVKLGGQGCIVATRPRWPEGVSSSAGLLVSGTLAVPLPIPPSETANNSRSLEQWRMSSGYFSAQSMRYPAFLEADGIVRADEIPPGKYVFTLTARDPQASGSTNVLFQGTLPVTVRASPATGTIDAGEIVMRPVESAPRAEAKAQ